MGKLSGDGGSALLPPFTIATRSAIAEVHPHQHQTAQKLNPRLHPHQPSSSYTAHTQRPGHQSYYTAARRIAIAPFLAALPLARLLLHRHNNQVVSSPVKL